MKKLSWIIAMFAVLGLLFVGCPEDDGKEKENGGDIPTLAASFPNTVSNQDKATVTLSGNTVTFSVTGTELWGELINTVGFNATAYSGIKFEYMTTGEDTSVHLLIPDNDYGCTFAWFGTLTETDWTYTTLLFKDLEYGWGEADKTFSKSTINKFMIGSGGNEATSMNRKLEIRNFTWVK
jgi:hypothetical protein